jgi:polyisoprenoid-binding protein YceI
MKAMRFLLIAASLTTLQLKLLHAQAVTVKNYDVTIAGTSTLHNWESKAEKIECTASFLLANNTVSDVKDVLVKIPVKSIKSAKGKIMDKKTWEAFHYEKHPSIIFVMTDRKINASKNTIEVTGDLTMAGVTRQIEFIVTYKMLPDANLQISGSKQLRMTDFKMEPPTAMMGTIKVADEITISFQIVLTQNQTL